MWPGGLLSPLGWPPASATHQAIQPCQEKAATASQVAQVTLTLQEKVTVPSGTQVPVRGDPSPHLSATTRATPAPTPPGQAGPLKLCPVTHVSPDSLLSLFQPMEDP